MNLSLIVKVVHVEGCDGTPPTVERIREVAREMSLAVDLEKVLVGNEEEARVYRHIGSPTVQVEGMDILPEARGLENFTLG